MSTNTAAKVIIRRVKRRHEIPSLDTKSKLIVEGATIVVHGENGFSHELVLVLSGPVSDRGETFAHDTRVSLGNLTQSGWNVANEGLFEACKVLDRDDPAAQREVFTEAPGKLTIGFRDNGPGSGPIQTFIRAYDARLGREREIVLGPDGLHLLRTNIGYLVQ